MQFQSETTTNINLKLKLKQKKAVMKASERERERGVKQSTASNQIHILCSRCTTSYTKYSTSSSTIQLMSSHTSNPLPRKQPKQHFLYNKFCTIFQPILSVIGFLRSNFAPTWAFNPSWNFFVLYNATGSWLLSVLRFERQALDDWMVQHISQHMICAPPSFPHRGW